MSTIYQILCRGLDVYKRQRNYFTFLHCEHNFMVPWDLSTGLSYDKVKIYEEGFFLSPPKSDCPFIQAKPKSGTAKNFPRLLSPGFSFSLPHTFPMSVEGIATHLQKLSTNLGVSAMFVWRSALLFVRRFPRVIHAERCWWFGAATDNLLYQILIFEDLKQIFIQRPEWGPFPRLGTECAWISAKLPMG